MNQVITGDRKSGFWESAGRCTLCLSVPYDIVQTNKKKESANICVIVDHVEQTEAAADAVIIEEMMDAPREEGLTGKASEMATGPALMTPCGEETITAAAGEEAVTTGEYLVKTGEEAEAAAEAAVAAETMETEKAAAEAAAD